MISTYHKNYLDITLNTFWLYYLGAMWFGAMFTILVEVSNLPSLEKEIINN